MDDMISRAEAIAEVEEYLKGLDSCISEDELKLDGYRNGLQVAIYELNKVPAVDAEPVVHGRWINKNEESVYGPTYCSVCDFELRIDDMPYCPMCGAKMDKDKE